MKKKLLRLMLLPVIVSALLTVHSFTTVGTAHAATLQPHVSQSSASIGGVACGATYIWEPVEIDAKYGYDPECFEGTGGQYVNLYDVKSLFTGAYALSWDWVDCNGATHYSVKGPYTEVTASNSPGLYAGYYVMCEITFIAMS